MTPPISRLTPTLAGLLAFVLLGSITRIHAADPYGYTEPYRTIEISCSEPGILAKIHVKEGQRVKKDQILAELDNRVLQQEVNIAKEQLSIRTKRVEKLRDIFKKGRSSKDEMDRAESDLKVEQYKTGRMEAQLERTIMRTPVEGLVTLIKRDEAESISAVNAHVLTVVQLDQLQVSVFLTPDRARTMTQDQPVTLYTEETSEAIPAKVEFISPVTDSATDTVRVKFVVDNRLGLVKTGLRVRLDPRGNTPES